MEDALYWLVGAVGVPLINWLKNMWGLKGKSAMWLTAAVAALLALIAILFNGHWEMRQLGPEELLEVFGQILAAATLAYNLLRSSD